MLSQPAESLRDLHERRLDSLKVMVQGGSAIAIAAATHYCSRNDMTVPRWLVQADAAQYPDSNMRYGFANRSNAYGARPRFAESDF